jgi:hypothetical protein
MCDGRRRRAAAWPADLPAGCVRWMADRKAAENEKLLD